MSWEAVKHVMDSSKAVDTDRLVLLALAESANTTRWETWIGIATIGRKAGGKSDRTVQRSLQRLTEMNELRIVIHGAPQFDRKFQYRTNLYAIVRPIPAYVSSSGDTPDTTRSPVVTHSVSSGDTGVVTRVTPKPEVSKPSLETTTTEALSVDDEIEAGIKLAVKRIADLQEKGAGFRKSRRAFEIGTDKTLRLDRASEIAKARAEQWSAERLADELQPAPYCEPVAVGANKDPGVMYCHNHRCYLSECPPSSGHRAVRTKIGEQDDPYIYSGQTFQHWRLWDSDLDRGATYTESDGSVWEICARNNGNGSDCAECGNSGSILVSLAEEQS